MKHKVSQNQSIKQITGSRESVSADDREGDQELNIGDVFRQVEAIHSPPKSVKVKSDELPSDTHMTDERLKYTLELKRLEMEERKHDREMQMQIQMQQMQETKRMELESDNRLERIC